MKDLKGMCLINCLRQGQNQAFTVLFVPNSLDSGPLSPWHVETTLTFTAVVSFIFCAGLYLTCIGKMKFAFDLH